MVLTLLGVIPMTIETITIHAHKRGDASRGTVRKQRQAACTWNPLQKVFQLN